MLVGKVNYWIPSEEARLVAQAATIFNAFENPGSGVRECEAQVTTTPLPERTDAVSLSLGFIAGNHLQNPMDWNTCIQSLNEAQDYLAQRPV